MKESRLLRLSLLLVATLFVQNAAAEYLPYSSHYWGRSYFDEPNMSGYVYFAVYDTQAYEGASDEWASAGFDAPGDGQYIYAYQIFSDAGSADAIERFTIMGLDDHQLIGIDTMTSQDPWEDYLLTTEGVEPTGTETNLDETRATWVFEGGILVAGEYSWFLIFSSANDWVKGEYEIQSTGGFPVPDNPEPCTIALLGLGGAILFAKRRNSAKWCRTRSHT